jgi:CRISPR-associated protein Csd1
MVDQHPAKLRNDGDKAKLISSNDGSGFTFRGRYQNADQACGVGFEATQMAHNALRWLIARQGYRRGDQAIVAWDTSGVDILSPFEDGYDVLGWGDMEFHEAIVDTAQDIGIQLRKRIAGYGSGLGNTNRIVVLGLDSATPGRMAMTYYRELTGSDFLSRLNRWHTECSWYHSYRTTESVDKATGKKVKIRRPFVGAPAPNDIAEAAYGTKIDDRLRKATVERLLPCIVDGQPIPKDIVNQAVQRASNRVCMDDWEWQKTLSIACALFAKYKVDTKKEVYGMSLDETRKTRDYLYGRLLALADNLEQWALQEAGENRQTNAARYMQRFSERPFSTWRNIELSLSPSKARLGLKAKKRLLDKISEVTSLFEPEEFTNDKKLSGEFLLGYHCQREALRRKNTDDQE